MRVFGYGSLVNNRTHDHDALSPARLTGWRRVWTATTLREVAFLSVEEAPGAVIAGLLATVPGGDQAALDTRETGYLRRQVVPEGEQATLYQVDPELQVQEPGSRSPILLSYLDVVVEGYFDHFGPDGVRAFGQSTSGWHLPVLDDRAAPRYPRSTRPPSDITALCDELLAQCGARRIMAD